MIDKHGFCPHLYADNTQIYGRKWLTTSSVGVNINSWMQSNRLQLNTSKTELLLFVVSIYRGPPSLGRRLCETSASLLMPISACARTSNGLSPAAFLRQHCSIRRSVPLSVFQTLVVALVLSMLDYGNVTLASLPVNLLNLLQSVLNAAARSVAGLRWSDNITKQFSPEEIKFKRTHCLPSSAALHLGICLIYCAALLTSHQDGISSRCPPVNWSRLVTIGDRSFAVAGPRLCP